MPRQYENHLMFCYVCGSFVIKTQVQNYKRSLKNLPVILWENTWECTLD